MSFLEISFIGRPFCRRRRSQAAPAEFVFLRNYKRRHRDRIGEAISRAALGQHILVVNAAFDDCGRRLPQKVSVYATNTEVAALFFQHYVRLKAEQQRSAKPSVAVARLLAAS